MSTGELVYLDFGMMSEAPQSARYGIMEHIAHLVNRDYYAMANDYYKLGFLAPVSLNSGNLPQDVRETILTQPGTSRN
jgi:predicted unusual protein kinase regulating ubiquinone biosynthesis (AarF/ABC1/UbiB family)